MTNKDLLFAANELKYLIDIQPVGAITLLGRGDIDVRDSETYKRASSAIDRAEALLAFKAVD